MVMINRVGRAMNAVTNAATDTEREARQATSDAREADAIAPCTAPSE